MLKSILGCNMQLCRIRTLRFLLFLFVFAISPVVDACVDSLCPPLVFNDPDNSDSPTSIINDLKLNDARKSLHALNRASKQNQNDLALSLRALAAVGPAGRITKPQLAANDKCSSQRCSLASSDPSPPVA
jgi:hypothetical protein